MNCLVFFDLLGLGFCVSVVLRITKPVSGRVEGGVGDDMYLVCEDIDFDRRTS